jgi:diguanylate cyclase (GGDEF)-like protein
VHTTGIVLTSDGGHLTEASSRTLQNGPIASQQLRLVRVRLVLVLLATSVVSLICGAAVSVMVDPGARHRVADALRAAAIPPLVLFAVVFAGAVILTYSVSRQVVRPAEELDLAHQRLANLYESARAHALEDSLTSLGNHRAFQEEFDRQLDAVRRYGAAVALVLIDLDDFKTVNDSAGHAVGDGVLLELSALLRGGIRRSDRAFRIGGDEFAVLMPQTTAQEASLVARRLLASCLEPRTGDRFTHAFSFSAGITASPEMGTIRAELLEQADEALYECKRNGRTGIRIHDPARETQRTDAPRLLRASGSVVEIVQNRAVRPAYQPLVDLRTGEVVGFEGLVRLVEEAPFSDPASLFVVAEATGRTTELDHMCISAILAGASQLGPRQSIGLNLSPKTVEAPEFSPQPLVNMLAAVGLTPDRAILELTERQGVEEIDRLRDHLVACQAVGFRVAIDDVGAGNSGLRLLSQVHFDIVKIDLSLVQAGARREASLELLRSLADLATRWGANAVAEGLETAAQLRMVRSLGLSEGQGYLLGRPAPVPSLRKVDLEALMREPDLLTVLGVALPQPV